MAGGWEGFGSCIQVLRDDVSLVVLELEKLAYSTVLPLLEELREVASAGFGHQVSSESIKRHTVEGQDLLFVVIDKNKAVGFASVRRIKDVREGVFLTGIVILPEYQGRGFGQSVLKSIIESGENGILVFTTQSPRMYSSLLRVSSRVFPDVAGSPIPLHLQELGQRLMVGRRGCFCETTFVCTGIYPECLYPAFPWCSSEVINFFFRRKLSFQGDKIGELR